MGFGLNSSNFKTIWFHHSSSSNFFKIQKLLGAIQNLGLVPCTCYMLHTPQCYILYGYKISIEIKTWVYIGTKHNKELKVILIIKFSILIKFKKNKINWPT